MRRLPQLLVLLVSLLTAAPALAAPKGAIFGLRAVGNPKLGYFVYPAPAGSVVRGAVTVSNSGDRAGTVKLYAADATTGTTTGAVYLTDATAKRAGSWIRLDHATLTLKPGGHQKVSFTGAIPGSAGPGQYVAGMVAEAVTRVAGPRSKRKANVQIKVRNLSIVAVQVDIPGPQKAQFAIGDAKPGGSRGFQQIVVHVANTGTLLRKPSGTLVVTNGKGKRIESVKFQMDTFVPHTEIDYPITLTKALGPGDYHANVTLRFSSAGGGAAQTTGAPSFAVSRENVQQVFTSSKPTAAPPGIGSSSSSGGTPAWLWALIAAGIIGVAVGAALFLRRSPDGESTAAAGPDPCDPYHYWEVDPKRFVDGPGGRRTLHRCSRCGLEVMAVSIDDATAQADALRPRPR